MESEEITGCLAGQRQVLEVQQAKTKTETMGAVAVASMDDVDTYGRMCYKLGFGKAVEKDILTDYKIVVMQISENTIPAST